MHPENLGMPTRNRVGCNRSRGLKSRPFRHNIVFNGITFKSAVPFSYISIIAIKVGKIE